MNGVLKGSLQPQGGRERIHAEEMSEGPYERRSRAGHQFA